jgi:hypothetical protein
LQDVDVPSLRRLVVAGYDSDLTGVIVPAKIPITGDYILH